MLAVNYPVRCHAATEPPAMAFLSTKQLALVASPLTLSVVVEVAIRIVGAPVPIYHSSTGYDFFLDLI